MALLCKKIDLDLETERDVYENAVETVTYLNDIIQSIEKRVLGGEKIDGFIVVEGKKTRSITQEGLQYLEKAVGHDKVYKTIEKPIGVGDLDKMFDATELAALVTKGYVVYTPGAPKVAVLAKN